MASIPTGIAASIAAAPQAERVTARPAAAPAPTARQRRAELADRVEIVEATEILDAVKDLNTPRDEQTREDHQEHPSGSQKPPARPSLDLQA